MKCFEQWIGIIANCAAILTAIIAAFAWGNYKCEQNRKMKKLEDYLKKEKAAGEDKGQRSILHLVANVGLTESEIIQASFRSKCIKRAIVADKETQLADVLMLEYKKKP